MPKIKLDRTDIKLLQQLQANGKISNIELAEKVGLSPSPCLRRVKALEDNGIIKQYVAIVDAERLGSSINVFMTIRLKSQERAALETFESHISQYEEVMECYLMTGTSDYFLRILVSDIHSYEQFLLDKISTIDVVGNIESSFALKQVLYKTSMPIHTLTPAD